MRDTAFLYYSSMGQFASTRTGSFNSEHAYVYGKLFLRFICK